ncbi:transposase [Halopseudomonas yangmingensis]|uniref:transposase n=1 Tax=Halopseudomonas yangmingensis TaxID=1720063 RepID=UPI000B85B07C
MRLATATRSLPAIRVMSPPDTSSAPCCSIMLFMTNHIHLLATPTGPDSICLMMQALGRRYVRYFNSRHRRTGTLWEGRYKSCLVDSDGYLLHCQRYIELNPVRAAMVAAPGDYRWSSYRTNAFGKASRLVSPHALYQKLGSTPAELPVCLSRAVQRSP